MFGKLSKSKRDAGSYTAHLIKQNALYWTKLNLISNISGARKVYIWVKLFNLRCDQNFFMKLGSVVHMLLESCQRWLSQCNKEKEKNV